MSGDAELIFEYFKRSGDPFKKYIIFELLTLNGDEGIPYLKELYIHPRFNLRSFIAHHFKKNNIKIEADKLRKPLLDEKTSLLFIRDLYQNIHLVDSDIIPVLIEAMNDLQRT